MRGSFTSSKPSMALLRLYSLPFSRSCAGHGAAVVVDVVAALAVGEDLDALDEAGGVGRGRGQRVGAVRVPDAEGDLDGLGVDEGRAAGQRDAADPRGCGGEGAQRAGEVCTSRRAVT